MTLGQTIRYYRKERNLTLEQLAKQCNLSVAQISKLENAKSNPSVGSLRKLADAFEIPLSALTLVDAVPRLEPVLNGEGFTMRWCGKGEHAVLVRYLTLRRDAKMQPIIVSIPAGVDSGASRSHPGDEFFYVLEGKIRFYYGEKDSFEMNKGDFLYYEGHIPHHWENLGEKTAYLLTCNTPPVM